VVVLKAAPSEADEVVSLVRPDDGHLQVTVHGPNRSIQWLLGEAPTRLLRLDWPVPGELDSGRHRFNAVEQLDDLAYFKDRALSVTAVEPRTFEVEIDRYVWTELPVEARVLAHHLVGAAQIDPPTIRARILSSALRRIRPHERRIALLLDERLNNQPEGKLLRMEVPVPVRLGPATILPEPDHVIVKLTLRERTSEKRLEPVVIKFLLDARTWQEYIPSPDYEIPLTQAITVRGPKEIVEQLKPEDVVGQIEITSRDLTDPTVPRWRQPHFILPPGVELVGEPPPVEFALMPLK